MNEMDLIRSLDWLRWVQNAHAKGKPQNEIDRFAVGRMTYIRDQLSPEALDIYEDALADGFGGRAEGSLERSMTAACEAVILEASEEDWRQYVLPYEDQISIWKPIWDSVRRQKSK